MMRFSERNGYVAPKIALAETEISLSLRTKIWNVFTIYFFQKVTGPYSPYNYEKDFETFAKRLRFHFFDEAIDDLPDRPADELERIRDRFFAAKFPVFYDFIEEAIRHFFFGKSDFSGQKQRKDCIISLNEAFSYEKCQFRIVDGQITKITSDLEIQEIEAAVSTGGPVETHISAAVSLFSRRPAPDYRNSIKEAISAVEAASKVVSGDDRADLSRALSAVEKKISMHSQMKTAFKNLYNWTSDANGIRHAMMDEAKISEAEARFMIVACSAFANMLLALSRADSRQ